MELQYVNMLKRNEYWAYSYTQRDAEKQQIVHQEPTNVTLSEIRHLKYFCSFC